MGAQAIAGGSGRVKGGLRLRFPLPVPKSEAWTGGRYQTPVFLQRKMTSGRQSGGRAVPEDQKGLSYYRIILHLQVWTLRPREGKRLAPGSQRAGRSVGPQAPAHPRSGSKLCLRFTAHATK